MGVYWDSGEQRLFIVVVCWKSWNGNIMSSWGWDGDYMSGK